MPDKLSPVDFPANPLEKTGYILEFNDEFDGDVRCSSIQTGQFAGPVGSKLGQLRFSSSCVVREAQTNVQKYTPQYGYFELRARGVNTSANHAAFWMIGYEDTPEKSGEIAICELVGSHTSSASSGVRFGVHPWGDQTLQDEFYEQFLKIDATQHHIYGVEWTPTHFDFYVDNVKTKTINQSPKYPMQFMLGIYEHPFDGAWTGVYDPSAPYPKSLLLIILGPTNQREAMSWEMQKEDEP